MSLLYIYSILALFWTIFGPFSALFDDVFVRSLFYLGYILDIFN